MGGAEIMCETLSNCLKSIGHEVMVVSLYNKETVITERLKKKGLKVIFLNKKKGFDLACIKNLRQVINNYGPDVIHTHLYSVKYAILATIFSRKAIIHTIHNVAEKETGYIDRRFNEIFYRTGKVIPVALSDLVRLTVEKEYKLNSVHVILNGVNLSSCIPKEDYDICQDFQIINIARFSEQKNHHRLIAAFEMLEKEYKNVKLILIGDGELKEEIVKEVNNSSVCNKVTFLGLQKDVYPFLNKSDCFALSSDFEGIPMTVIEAMGTGLPIVSTKVGGLADMIRDGENGMLTELTPKGLCDAFMELISDKDRRQRLGENARISAFDYSVEKMTEKYVHLYEGTYEKQLEY